MVLVPVLAGSAQGVHGCVPVEVRVQGLKVMLRDISPNKLPIAGPNKAGVLPRLVVEPMVVDGVIIV